MESEKVVIKKRVIPSENNMKQRVFYMCLLNNVTADTCIKVMEAICESGNGRPVGMTLTAREHIARMSGLTVNTVNVALHRLVKKKVLVRQKKVYNVHPGFANLLEYGEFVIRFNKNSAEVMPPDD